MIQQLKILTQLINAVLFFIYMWHVNNVACSQCVDVIIKKKHFFLIVIFLSGLFYVNFDYFGRVIPLQMGLKLRFGPKFVFNFPSPWIMTNQLDATSVSSVISQITERIQKVEKLQRVFAKLQLHCDKKSQRQLVSTESRKKQTNTRCPRYVDCDK